MTTILLIGPLPPPMGGDTRHFSTLLEDLGRSGELDVIPIDTSRGRNASRFLDDLRVASLTTIRLLAGLRRADIVSFHASDRGMLLFGPVVLALAQLGGKRVILRLFGGSFGDVYLAGGRLTRATIRLMFRSADAVLLQTRRMIHQLREHAPGHLIWLPTYVKAAAPPHGEAPRHGCRQCANFVYLGHLWKTKGVETILAAAPALPADVRIDLYGPLDEYSAEEIAERGKGRVRYRGMLTHEQVDGKLWEYDCLVLPTWHPGEGYPSVIAEAFAHGLPVITTRWLAIPEMVDRSCGILIEPKDTEAFVVAVTSLHRDNDLWGALKQGARSRARRFAHSRWSTRFEILCKDLLRPQPDPCAG